MACVLKPVVETVALAASLGSGVLCALPSRGPCAGVSLLHVRCRLQLLGVFFKFSLVAHYITRIFPFFSQILFK